MAESPKLHLAKMMIYGLQPYAKIRGFLCNWQEHPEPMRECQIVIGCVDSYKGREELEPGRLGLIRRRQAAELEPQRVQAARGQLPHALLDATTDGFDAPQRKILRGIDLQGDVFARQGAALVERKAVGRAADGALGIFGRRGSHG